MRMVGVPYSEEMMANAQADFKAQADPNGDSDGLQERYGAAAFGQRRQRAQL